MDEETTKILSLPGDTVVSPKDIVVRLLEPGPFLTTKIFSDASFLRLIGTGFSLGHEILNENNNGVDYILNLLERFFSQHLHIKEIRTVVDQSNVSINFQFFLRLECV